VQICKVTGSVTCSNNSNWTTLGNSFTSNETNWQQVSRDIPTTFLNSPNVKIRFRMTRSSDSGTRTWYIDDVKIGGASQLVDWSTIAVRITEKTVTDSYFGSGSQRVNDIELFYGTPTPNGTADRTTPLDNNRDGNRQDQYNWPPNPIPTSPTTLPTGYDYLTLVSGWNGWNESATTHDVQMDAFKSGFSTTIQGQGTCKFRLLGEGNELNAVIRTNCYLTNTLTQSSFTNRYEVGLVAFGDHAANNIYFDNFGFKFPGSTGGSDGSGSFIQY
jgi:hypothetical protein